MVELPDDSELRALLAGKISRARERQITELLSKNAELQRRLERLSGETDFREDFALSEERRNSTEIEEPAANPVRVGKFESWT